jgi:hypothetical protein
MAGRASVSATGRHTQRSTFRACSLASSARHQNLLCLRGYSRVWIPEQAAHDSGMMPPTHSEIIPPPFRDGVMCCLGGYSALLLPSFITRRAKGDFSDRRALEENRGVVVCFVR